MKKRILYIALLTTIVLLVSSVVPALAAWIPVIRNVSSVKEPLIPRAITLDPQEVLPGQEIVWVAEVKNTADNISYGVQYYTWAYYDYYSYDLGMGAMGMQTTSTSEAAPAPTKNTERLSIEMTAYAGGGGTSTSIGELILFVDPDGLAGPLPQQRYVPGSTVNIQPGQTQVLTLKLNVSLSADPGTVVSYIQPYRTAPVTQ